MGGLDVDDADRLFTLLDENRDGELGLDEFLSGCLRLKGLARSIDVFGLIHQTRQLCRRVEQIDQVLHEGTGARSNGSAWLMPPLPGKPHKTTSFSSRELCPRKAPPDAAR